MTTEPNDPRRAEHDDSPNLTDAGKPRQRARRGTMSVPIRADLLEGAPHFAPVPRKASRYDGWTYPRQRAFIKALAETGCVARACRRLGMTTVGVYLLRKVAGADEFNAAWEEAQAVGVQRLHDIAMERAIYGTPKPIFYKGEQVGEERRYNDRLLNSVLRHHDPEGWGWNQQGSRIAPHIRRKLYAQWEAEHAAREVERHEDAQARLAAKLEEMGRRMRDE